jgi:hypothetical protein
MKNKLLVVTLFSIILLSLTCCGDISQKPEEITLSGDINNHFYSKLSLEQRDIYDIILTGLVFQKERIDIPRREMAEISSIFGYLLRENPKIFYTNTFTLSTRSKSTRATVIPDYKYTRSQITEYTELIERHLQNFEHIKYASDFEKELYVQNYILKNFRYDHNLGELAYNVLGLILNRTAVCQGIAFYVKMVLDHLDVHSLVVYGRGNDPTTGISEGHAWNIVRIDGLYYHLDATYNLSLSTRRNRYDYFNLSDFDIKKDHIISDKNLPLCFTSGQDYYTLYGMTVNGMAALDNYFANAIRHGEKTIIVKVNNVAFSQRNVDMIFDKALQKYVDIMQRSARAKVSYNESQMVFEIQF